MQLWDDESPANKRLLLLTPKEMNQLPDGTVVMAIDGTHEVKLSGVKNMIDEDTRFGHLSWGLPIEMQDHARDHV